MDAVIRGERGQALVLAVPLIGLAALVVTGLLAAQDRLVADLALRRAGEAAAAAAGAAVADLELAEARRLGRELVPADVARLAQDERVAEAARAAAARMTSAHGLPPAESVVVLAFGIELEVHLTLRGRRHVVLLAPPA